MSTSGGIIVLALLAAAPDAGVAPLLAPDIAPLVPPAPEYTLSLRENEWRVHVTFRPGEPIARAPVAESFNKKMGSSDENHPS